jgi:ATP-independent RNA helicase DbpA
MSATDFSKLGLKAELTAVLAELGFERPTEIQAKALPVLLQGRDLIGQSKTGSGKTLAFSLPILQKIDLSLRRPQALVLCPTRELAVQVAREIRRVGRKLPGLGVAVLTGGQPVGAQIPTLRMGSHIAVGTPGRVLDHLKRQSLDLRRASTVVLDEADRMLDMGFEEQMQEIFAVLPEKRQTVLFSATFPERIEEISRGTQNDPVRVTVENTEASVAIEELACEVQEEDKLSALLWVLRERGPEQAIVFCNLKATVVDLTHCLREAGLSAAALQGDMEQSERDREMAKFRNKSTRVLVATDVAARGIDVEALDLVVNFDMPKPDVYRHRIGRTGRAGKEGVAVSFLTPKEKYKLRDLGTTPEALTLPRDLELAESAEAPSVEAAMTTLFISGGRKDKMRPGDILGALTGEAGGFKGEDIGKIEIHDRFSYVAVNTRVAEPAMHRLREGKIKGRKFRIELVR